MRVESFQQLLYGFDEVVFNAAPSHQWLLRYMDLALTVFHEINSSCYVQNQILHVPKLTSSAVQAVLKLCDFIIDYQYPNEIQTIWEPWIDKFKRFKEYLLMEIQTRSA